MHLFFLLSCLQMNNNGSFPVHCLRLVPKCIIGIAAGFTRYPPCPFFCVSYLSIVYGDEHEKFAEAFFFHTADNGLNKCGPGLKIIIGRTNVISKKKPNNCHAAQYLQNNVQIADKYSETGY